MTAMTQKESRKSSVKTTRGNSRKVKGKATGKLTGKGTRKSVATEHDNQPGIPRPRQRVPHAYVRGMMKGAVKLGHEPADILRHAGLPPGVYDDPQGSLNGEEFLKLLVALEQITQDVFMGFLEQPGKVGMQMAHIRLWVEAKTLGEAIRNSTQLREQLRNDVRYEYINDKREGSFLLGIDGYEIKPGMDPFLFYWHRLMQIYRSYCWLVGKRIRLMRVGFAMPRPKELDDVQAMFHCEVRFDQSTNYLCFERHGLKVPIVRSEAELLHGDLHKNYPDWFSIPGFDHSWVRQVEDLLLQLLQEKGSDTSLSALAADMNVSTRTLRRQLLVENDSFQGVKDRVRLYLASKMLASSDTPITRIAGELGYAEPGSFTRAFLNWTQCTPSSYRRQHRIEEVRQR